MREKSIYFFIGTTAELIKLAPVIKELKKRKIKFKILSSGQNVLRFDELKPIIGKQKADYTFKLKPISVRLNIYVRFAIWIIKSLTNYLLYFRSEFKELDRKNLLFIVHGDTVSSLMGAFIAKIYGVKLAHIESGLRSYNFLEPFPEEISRYLVSRLADLHFCPNSWAVKNLEGYRGVKINTQNNTIAESLLPALSLKNNPNYSKLIPKEKFFLFVLHRQEHVMFKKKRARKYLELITSHAKNDLKCILILLPLTEKFLKREKVFQKIKKNKNIILMPRLPFIQFIHLLDKAQFIATDGGSNQEESYYLGKPCLILRNVTERTDGLGKNAVLSKGKEDTILHFTQNYKKYKRGRARLEERPSKIIVDYLSKH